MTERMTSTRDSFKDGWARRKRGVNRAWLLLTAAGPLLISTLAHGQFQAPTNEELTMTAEPKAPGADAIYLYREETVDDNLHYHSSYVRIKVLTEKAKELATVHVPYEGGDFTVGDVKARTIHADGKVIPLDVKPADLMDQKGKGFQFKTMVFTLPSVEVGSILEFRWDLRYKDEVLSSPEWAVQQPYFVRKAHYSFIPYKFMDRVTNGRGETSSKLLYSSVLPANVKVSADAAGRYLLDLTDVPPAPEEEFMPPLDSWMERVTFYYSPYSTKEEFWKHEGGRWAKEVDHFADETKTLKEAAAGIVAPADTEEVKARKLYDAVMALENTNYTRRKSQAELKGMHLKEAKDAEDVWKQKSGTSDEIAMLYLALVRSAGLKAYALTVCNRDRAIFNPYFLQMRQFDDILVNVVINGKEVLVDPGKKFAGFGQLDWRHTLAGSLRESDKGPVFEMTPGNAYKDAATLRTADLTVSADGSVKGIVRISMNGPAANRWREQAIENDEDELKKEFNEEMRRILPDGVEAEFDHFLGLEDYHLQLMGVVKISGNLGNATGKRVFVPGAFFASRGSHPFVADEKRRTAVDMHYADVIRDEVVFHLPQGFKVESAPVETTIPWSGRATLQPKSVASDSDLTMSRVLVRGFTMLEPKEYPALREFYQKVAAADQQQVVLTSGTSGKASGQ